MATRRIHIAGCTPNPNAKRMTQVARNMTLAGDPVLAPGTHLLRDRDGTFTAAFDATLAAAGVKVVKLPAHSPNLNAFAERWVRSVKSECPSRMILFGEESLRRALLDYCEHYHAERPHRGMGNFILFPEPPEPNARNGPIACHERLGGLLKFYHREAG